MELYEEINCAGTMLRGMVHRPDSFKKAPLVFMFHGYTGNRQEIHRMFVKFSRILAQNGIASARFDFSGSGESDGEFCNMTFQKELEEARYLMDHMLQKDYIDPGRVMLLGLSMGGAVASVLAPHCALPIKKICLWAAAGKLKEAILKTIYNNTGADALGEKEDTDNKAYVTGRAFIDELDSIDILGQSRGYGGKVLLIRGDQDDIVTEDCYRRYQNIYGSRARLHIVEGAGHTFDSRLFEQDVFAVSLKFLAEED